MGVRTGSALVPQLCVPLAAIQGVVCRNTCKNYQYSFFFFFATCTHCTGGLSPSIRHFWCVIFFIILFTNIYFVSLHGKKKKKAHFTLFKKLWYPSHAGISVVIESYLQWTFRLHVSYIVWRCISFIIEMECLLGIRCNTSQDYWAGSGFSLLRILLR